MKHAWLMYLTPSASSVLGWALDCSVAEQTSLAIIVFAVVSTLVDGRDAFLYFAAGCMFALVVLAHSGSWPFALSFVLLSSLFAAATVAAQD